MRISDWSADVCSSDLRETAVVGARPDRYISGRRSYWWPAHQQPGAVVGRGAHGDRRDRADDLVDRSALEPASTGCQTYLRLCPHGSRSEEHTSELQSLMRI